MRPGILAFAILLALTGVLSSSGHAGATDSDYRFKTIDFPGADNTFARGINNNGDIVGDYTFPPADRAGREAGNAFVLHADGSFSTITYPGAYDTFGNGINDSGVVVGNCLYEFYGTFGTCQNFEGVVQGWVYSGGSFSLVNFPGSISNATDARGINKSGQIVGAYEDPSPVVHGYVLSGGTYTSINAPGVPNSISTGINDAGQIVVISGYDPDPRGSFLLSGIGGTFTKISVPGANETNAIGINNRGAVVGYYNKSATGPWKSFVWHSKSGTFDLFTDPLGVGGSNPAVGSGTVATGINDAGQVVGFYVDSNGAVHGFVAHDRRR